MHCYILNADLSVPKKRLRGIDAGVGFMGKVEFVTGSPSHYSNHVLIERIGVGVYRFEGASNIGIGPPIRLVSRQYYGMGQAKLAAAAWALENGVTLIYLPQPS